MTDQLALPPGAETTTAVLRHFSWVPTSKVPGRYEVWTEPNTRDELLVPVNPENGDFQVLLSRVTRAVLARYGSEARHLIDLLDVTSSAALDSTRWSKETTVNAGLIPWTEGEGLFTAAKDSLVASARSVYTRRLHHGSSGSYLARQFLARTLMGQTEVGSFVITAHTPANERFHVSKKSANLPSDDWRQAEQVSGRAILDMFAQALEAVRTGLDEYRRTPTVDGFLPLAQDGVSYELVRALATITTGGDAAITITTHSDDPSKRPRSKEVVFDAVEAQVLDQVASRFAELPPPQQVRISGEVSLLDNSTTSPVHLVRLDVKEGASVNRARVRLTPEQYEIAVRAHADHLWLTVSGTLEKDGRDYWLYNTGDVDLVSPNDKLSAPPLTIYSEADFSEDPSELED